MAKTPPLPKPGRTESSSGAGPMYYARDGTPLGDDMLEWAEHWEDNRVDETTVGNWWISTVYLGLNHQWDPLGPPLIFETMIFPVTDDGTPSMSERWMDRYSTEEQAVAGHASVVALVEAGELPYHRRRRDG